MSIFSFVKRYFTRPRTVGAILPSSKYLAKLMIKRVNFATATTIAEFGPGTGAFTRQILAARNKDTIVILIERDKLFFDILMKEFHTTPNVILINDSAENIVPHLHARGIQSIDYIISGLPFASLPTSTAENILCEVKKILDGEFVTFQYSMYKKKLFDSFFSNIEIAREYRNIPPAYVLYCKADNK